MSFTLVTNQLTVKRLPSLTATPSWCMPYGKDPIVHCVKLIWNVQYMSDGGVCQVESAWSDHFDLGEQWLTAQLEIETYGAHLFLNVAPEHVEKFFGRVKVSTSSRRTILGESTINDSNVVNGNRWRLTGANSLYQAYSTNCIGSIFLAVDVYIEAIIPGCSEELESAFRKSTIADDVGLLLFDKDYADVTLKVGSTDFYAHKCILTARSPVLKAMLRSVMVEGITGVIELKNLSVRAAEDFIEYIYTARIGKENLMETAEELLSAAAMYVMPDLYTVCVTALRQNISAENAGRLLLLACLHDSQDLKADVLSFVKRNKAEVTATEGWNDVIDANPNLILDAIMDLV